MGRCRVLPPVDDAQVGNSSRVVGARPPDEARVWSRTPVRAWSPPFWGSLVTSYVTKFPQNGTGRALRASHIGIGVDQRALEVAQAVLHQEGPAPDLPKGYPPSQLGQQ